MVFACRIADTNWAEAPEKRQFGVKTWASGAWPKSRLLFYRVAQALPAEV
jgi:hypothetical protein